MESTFREVLASLKSPNNLKVSPAFYSVRTGENLFRFSSRDLETVV